MAVRTECAPQCRRTWLLHKGLAILENVTFACPENEQHLVEVAVDCSEPLQEAILLRQQFPACLASHLLDLHQLHLSSLKVSCPFQTMLSCEQ